jgi:NitT/TauT family transport system substrate-binding protein
MPASVKTFGILTAALAVVSLPAVALDKVRFVNSTKVVFEMEHAYTARDNGIFKKYDLDVSIIHGDGGSSSLQAVITGSQDVVWGNGALGVVGAFAKGAPVRVLGSNIRGVGEIFWYVKSDSPIKKFEDLKGGKSLAYSRPGSTTHLAVLFLQDALKLDAKLVSTGGPAASRTQVMSGQLETGWSAFPINADLIRTKKIRVIGTGGRAAGLNDVTIRVIAANANWLEKNRDVAKRLMKAMDEARKLTYVSEKQLRAYAKRWKMEYADVKDAGKYTTLENSTMLPIGNLAKINELSVQFKRIDKPLTAAQLKELVHPMGEKPM